MTWPNHLCHAALVCWHALDLHARLCWTTDVLILCRLGWVWCLIVYATYYTSGSAWQVSFLGPQNGDTISTRSQWLVMLDDSYWLQNYPTNIPLIHFSAHTLGRIVWGLVTDIFTQITFFFFQWFFFLFLLDKTWLWFLLIKYRKQEI